MPDTYLDAVVDAEVCAPLRARALASTSSPGVGWTQSGNPGTPSLGLMGSFMSCAATTRMKPLPIPPLLFIGLKRIPQRRFLSSLSDDVLEVSFVHFGLR